MTWAVIIIVSIAVGLGAGALIWARDDGLRPPLSDRSVAPKKIESSFPSGTPETGNLFVVESSRGWVTDAGDGWTVHLEPRRVLWFADRPRRASGTLAIRELIHRWPRIFYGSPPNAALVAPNGPEGERPTALVVRVPTVEGGIVSFPVTRDKGMSDAATSWLESLTRQRSGRTGLALFIDDSGTPTHSYVQAPPGTTLNWRPDLSQCAGYGQSSALEDLNTRDYMINLYVAFDVNSSGSCSFQRTWGRFDILRNGNRLGTVTFDSSALIDSCTLGSNACFHQGNDNVLNF